MLRALLLMALTIALAAGPALAAPANAPAGWVMEPSGEPKSCIIDGPTTTDARLGFATEGALLLLMVTSPKLPSEATDGAFKVKIDGGDWIVMPATAASHAAGISIGGALAHKVAAASRISISSGLGTWTFGVRNAGAAIDAVTTCAGEPTLGERDAMAPKPIADAGGWLLIDRIPDSPGKCSARLNGEEIDTMVLAPAPDGTFMLMAGRTDWATSGGEAEIGLAVDGAAPERLKA